MRCAVLKCRVLHYVTGCNQRSLSCLAYPFVVSSVACPWPEKTRGNTEVVLPIIMSCQAKPYLPAREQQLQARLHAVQQNHQFVLLMHQQIVL